MTITDERSSSAPAGPATEGRRPAGSPPAHPDRRRLFGVRAGQVVTVQVAGALVVAAAGHGPVALGTAALGAVVLTLAAWVRLRRRWLFEWLPVATRYVLRRMAGRGTRPGGPARLLELTNPGAELVTAELNGDGAGVIVDGYGWTTILALADPAALLADVPGTLPSPASLLPPAGAELPPVRVQFLVSGSPAPVPRVGTGAAATSYRQLTDGRVPGALRAVLAVRVLRVEGWSDDDLRRALASVVRRIQRRLGPVPARPLGAAPAVRVLAELAHFDGAGPAVESWPAIRVGGLVQAAFRLDRWPDPGAGSGGRLIPRLLTLPAAAITVSVGAGPGPAGTDAVPVDLTVRLAAESLTALSAAAQALHRLLAADGAQAYRLDGDQLAGLAATLPLGGPGPVPALSGDPLAAWSDLDAYELPIGAAGLMLGTNRHGAAVVVRLFRAEPTRALLIGGVRAAQLVTLRAMALGVRVVVQTNRPQAWEPFLRAVSTPGDPIALVPPGRPLGGPPATALTPLLVVVDVGPVLADQRPGADWQTSLVVRDEFVAQDADGAARADLVLLQPLDTEEAALVGVALGLGASAGWLTRIRADMIGVVSRRRLRWARLSSTPIEAQLIGPPDR